MGHGSSNCHAFLLEYEGAEVAAVALAHEALLTAYAGQMNQQQGTAAGLQKHISKLIEPEALVQEIASLVHLT